MCADVAEVAGRDDPVLRAVFVTEQMLGHITHGRNLERLVGEIADLDAVFLPIAPSTGRTRRLPVWSNWTVQSGIKARRALRHVTRRSAFEPDAMFVHTQVPAVLSGSWMERIPTVVSMDATPRQYDELGEHYDHQSGDGPVESMKHRLHRRAFGLARHVVSWSQWAKEGLIADYGVAPEKISVVSPGVDVGLWAPGPRRRPDTTPLRILFVGGDLQRKGGDLLIDTAARLASERVPPFELHLVTDPRRVDASLESVTVHEGLRPNSPELVELYRSADVFCLPTRADTFGVVLLEAAAAGLPTVATDVGAVSEIVRDEETGLVVPVDDPVALAAALRRMLVDGELRARLGAEARRAAVERHDARRNAEQLVDLMRAASGR